MSYDVRSEARPRSLRAHWLIALAVPLLLAGLAAPTGTAGADRAGCPDTQRFAVGGVGDPLGRHVPGASGATGIVYPASLAPIGQVPGDVSVAGGEVALASTARVFRLRCPQTAIHISGYSFGALVAGNVRDRWNDDPMMNQNTSFTLIADPRADEGAMTRLPSMVPGFTHTGKRPVSVIPTTAICRSASDFICHTGDPRTRPLELANGVLGYLLGDHTYRDHEVATRPGDHTVAGTTRLGPPPPLVSTAPPMAAPLPALESIVEHPAVTTAVAQVNQVVAAVTPPAQLSLTEYIPTPLRDYVPPPLAPLVPDRIADIVLPALPAMPLHR